MLRITAGLCAVALLATLSGCMVNETKPLPKINPVQATVQIPADELLDVGIIESIVSEEGTPELIVLGGEQPSENFLVRIGGGRPATIQPALEKLVQLAHATPATPAERLEFDVLAHRTNRPTAT